jgi:MFS family permease
MTSALTPTSADAELSPATAESRSGGTYKWLVVGMLWFICFLNYGDRQAISSIFPKLKDEFGFDKVQLGLIGSAFMWTYAFAAPVAGYLGDRLRRKNLILGGCLFWSFVTMTTSWCGVLWQFVTVRALEGLGETFYFPASMSLISDYHGPATRSKAMSFHQSSVYVGTVAGSWIAAWIAEHYGWRYAFYLFGGCGIVLAAVLFWFLVEPRRGQTEVRSTEDRAANSTPLSIAEVLRVMVVKPSVWLLMFAFLCAIFLNWTPTVLVEKFHFKLASAGLSGSAFIHLASAVSAPLGGVLADRLSRGFAGGRMLVQTFGLLLCAFFVFFVGLTNAVSTLLVAMTVFGFGKGLYDSNIFASLYDVIEPSARSTAAGIMNTVGWGGGALGPLVVGWMAKHGPYNSEIENMSHAIAYTAVIYIVGATAMLLVATIFIQRDAIPSAQNPDRNRL